MSTKIEGVPDDVADALAAHIAALSFCDDDDLKKRFGSVPAFFADQAISAAAGAQRCLRMGDRVDGFENNALLAAALLIASVVKSRRS